VDVDQVAYLRANSAAWRLLRADHAAVVLSFLGQVYVEENGAPVGEAALAGRLDDVLDGVRDDFPRPARDYLTTWAAPEQGWLRRFYPPGSSDEPLYDATPALEKAYGWVSGLAERSFVGTESRLTTLVDLLRQMVHGAETDPEARLAELRRRREEIDRRIAEVERGEVRPMDDVGLRDRYQLFAATARELLSDFREVGDNFRKLDRGARERIAGWAGSKGELLEELIGDRATIADSDQGRSFQAFYDFLLSRSQQDELADLLERVQRLPAIEGDPRMRHVDHDWMDAAERTQRTVRQLSEQLRRFLDDRVWLENRRVMDLLRSIEAHALAVRQERRPSLTMEIDAMAPEVSLPMERPLYAVRPEAVVDSAVLDDDAAELDTAALFEQAYVDQARLAGLVRSAVRRRGQVTLGELVAEHPPSQGLAEIVGYLALCEDDLAVVVDEDTVVRIPYVDSEGESRTLRMPQVSFARRTAESVRGSR
jgi:hypothetical protein